MTMRYVTYEINDGRRDAVMFWCVTKIIILLIIMMIINRFTAPHAICNMLLYFLMTVQPLK